MKQKQNTISLFAIVLLFLITITASAEPGRYRDDNYYGEKARFDFHGSQHRGRGPRRGPMFFGNLEHMQKELGLTEKQVDSISDINIAYKKKHLDLKEKLAPKRVKLQKLLIEEKVDLTKVKKLLKEIGEIQTEKRILMIKQHLDIEKVLTKVQRKKMRARRRERFSFNMHDPGRGRNLRHW